jgi:hypothetical protein
MAALGPRFAGGATGPRLPKFERRHFNALVTACHGIEAGLANASFVEGQQGVNEVMELVIARLGLMCAMDNPKFDSFTFTAACRKRPT